MKRINNTLLATLLIFVGALDAATSQEITWLARVPRVPASFYPSAQTVYHDPVRNKLATLGWQMGTILYSSDSGRTWSGDYNIFTDVVKKGPFLNVFPDGTYHYGGLTPWNAMVSLISEDGGASFRRLTTDPRMRRSDGYSVASLIIPPNVIVAYDTLGVNSYASVDYGGTWRPFPMAPGASSILNYAFPEPYVVLSAGEQFWYRMDTRSDTTWTLTTIPRQIRSLSLIGDLTVGSRFSELAVRSHPDSAFRLINSWPDPGTDTNAQIQIRETRIVNDSTIYAFDSRGFVLSVTAPSGTVQLVHRMRFRTPFHLQANLVKVMQFGDQVLAMYNDNWGYWYNGKRSRVFVHHDVTTGNVTEVTTKPRHTFLSSGEGSESFLGDIGFFMMSEDSELREVVRSTDHGATWRHTERVTIPLLDPTYLQMRHAVRLPNDSLILQTVYDHVIVRDQNGWLEPRQYATDAHDWTRYLGGYTHETAQYRRPTLTYDDGELYTFDPYIARLDPATMYELDTLLPRRASFLRRLTPDLLAAGRDSLWLSFNNGKEWVYVEGGMQIIPESLRAAVSDVVRLNDGTMLCSYRGLDWVDTSDTRGILAHGGITRSTDLGNTWTWVDGWPDDFPHVGTMTVLPSGTILAAAAHVEIDSALEREFADRQYTRVTRAGLWRSVDGGLNWGQVYTDFYRGGPFPDLERVMISMPNGTVVATTLSGLIIVSTDDGITWNILDLPQLGDALVYGMSLDKDGTLLLSTSIGTARLVVPGVTSVAQERLASADPALQWLGDALIVSNVDGQATLDVYDVLGRNVLSTVVGQGATEIPAMFIENGLLLYRLRMGERVVSGTVVR